MIKFLKKIDSLIFFNFFFQLFIILNKYYVVRFLNKKKYINKIYFNNKKNILSKLFEKNNSDKGYTDLKKNKFSWTPHTYDTIYYDLFNHCKEDIKLVFECGIGTADIKIPANMGSNSTPGASLRVWRDFFTNATIYGADIDRNVLFAEKRINTFYMDQLNPNSIKNMWKQINKNNFDIIIDDGMHSYKSSLIMFNNCYFNLRPGGIYFIEDVNYRYLKNLVNDLNKYDPVVVELTAKEISYQDNNLIIIRKK